MSHIKIVRYDDITVYTNVFRISYGEPYHKCHRLYLKVLIQLVFLIIKLLRRIGAIIKLIHKKAIEIGIKVSNLYR